MTTYNLSAINWTLQTPGPGGMQRYSASLPSFDPNVDRLVFDNSLISASDVGASFSGTASVNFNFYTSALPSLPVRYDLAVPVNYQSLTSGNVVFANGSQYLVGDNATSTTADDAANILTGTTGDDRIIGLGGNDVLSGGAGDDRFDAYYTSSSFGSDLIDGGAGTDTLAFSSSSSSTVSVNLATHAVSSAQGSATLTGIEKVFGSSGNDVFTGGDALHATDALGNRIAEAFRGMAGNDTITGAAGNDFLTVADYNSMLVASGVTVDLHAGSATNDGIIISGTSSYGVDTLSNVDMVVGTFLGDTLIGGSLSRDGAGFFYEIFRGNAGNDILNGNNAFSGGERASSDRADYANNSSAQSIVVNLGSSAITVSGQTVAAGSASDGMGGTDTLIDINQAYGGAGNDYFMGGGNNDTFDGGAGNDTLNGGDGSDQARFQQSTAGVVVNLSGRAISVDPSVYGVTGLASAVSVAAGTALDGMGGVDTLISIEQVRGSDFNDYIRGSDSNTREFFTPDAGNDFVDGGDGIDIVSFGDTPLSFGGITASLAPDSNGFVVINDKKGGTDVYFNIEGISGTNSADVLTGNAGSNWLRGGGGNDVLDGGGGADWVSYSNSPSGVVVNLSSGSASDGWNGLSGLLNLGGFDQLQRIENAEGSDFADSLTGDAGSNVLRGRYGDDTIDGSGGDDTGWFNGMRSDYALVFNVDGSLTVSDLREVPAIYQNSGSGGFYDGTDTLRNVEWLRFSDGVFDVRAATNRPAGYNVILGQIANNWGFENISGTAGNDWIDGLQGSDAMSGGSGNDVYVVGDWGDTVTEGSNAGIDTVISSLNNFALPANVENLTLIGSAAAGTGNELNNVFRVDSQAPLAFGSSGIWTVRIAPGAGNDSISGGTPAAVDGMTNFHILLDYGTNTAEQPVNANLRLGMATDGAGGTDTFQNVRSLIGGGGNDILTGGGSVQSTSGYFFETFAGGGGNDTIDGGETLRGYGNRAEYISSPAGVIVNLGSTALNVNGVNVAAHTASDGYGGGDALININEISGSAYDDRFYGADTTGLGISETFDPGAGNDYVNGGGGQDEVRYNGTPGSVVVNLGVADVTWNNGTTVVLPGTAYDGYGTVDTLVGIERARGGMFNDKLVGGDGDNWFEGWGGNDRIEGGGGIDYASYASSPTAVSVYLSAGQATVGDGFGGTDSLFDIEGIIGGRFDDTLVGGSGEQWLMGCGGNNFIAGGEGSDWVSYRRSPEPGGVTVDLAAGITSNNGWGGLWALGGGDSLSGIENVEGGDYNDRLTGDGGNNQFRGRGGDDTIVGGGGQDLAIYSGMHGDYQVSSGAGGIVTVRDLRSASGVLLDGVDTLQSIETLRFSDGDFAVPAGDTTPPALLSSLPADNASAVPAGSNLTLTFSEAVTAGTGNIVLTNTANGGDTRLIGVTDTTQVSISGSTVTVNPTADLQAGAHYALAMAAGVIKDAAGNSFAGISSPTVLDFTTAGAAGAGLHGIAYDWKNHYLLGGVNVTASGGGQPPEGANAPIQFKNVTWDAGGHGTAEVWGHSSSAYESFQVNLHVTGASSVAFTSNLNAENWMLLPNASGNSLILGGFANDAAYAIAAGDFKLGTVSFESGAATKVGLALDFAQVGLSNGGAYGQSLARVVSDTSGHFEVSGIDTGNYALTATRSVSDIGNAVTSADALAALKIAVGLNPNASTNGVQLALSPYQVMAADVVGTDGRVTSADALAILKMAVQISTAPAKEWLFVEETRDLWDEVGGKFTLDKDHATWNRALGANAQGDTAVNLVGVLKGDVNGSWQAPAGSTDLDVLQPNYFDSLHNLMNAPLSQWGITG